MKQSKTKQVIASIKKRICIYNMYMKMLCRHYEQLLTITVAVIFAP